MLAFKATLTSEGLNRLKTRNDFEAGKNDIRSFRDTAWLVNILQIGSHHQTLQQLRAIIKFRHILSTLDRDASGEVGVSQHLQIADAAIDPDSS